MGFFRVFNLHTCLENLQKAEVIFSDTQIYQGVGCLGPSAPACVSPVPVFLSYRPRKPSRCGFRWPGRNHGRGGSGGIGRWVSKLYCSHGVPERPRNDRLLHFPLAEFLEWCRVGEGHCLSNQLPFLSGFVRASRLPGGTVDPPP